jgi:hypothetical protein
VARPAQLLDVSRLCTTSSVGPPAPTHSLRPPPRRVRSRRRGLPDRRRPHHVLRAAARKQRLPEARPLRSAVQPGTSCPGFWTARKDPDPGATRGRDRDVPTMAARSANGPHSEPKPRRDGTCGPPAFRNAGRRPDSGGETMRPSGASTSLWPASCPRCGLQMRVLAVITVPQRVGRLLRRLITTVTSPPGLDAPCTDLRTRPQFYESLTVPTRARGSSPTNRRVSASDRGSVSPACAARAKTIPGYFERLARASTW